MILSGVLMINLQEPYHPNAGDRRHGAAANHRLQATHILACNIRREMMIQIPQNAGQAIQDMTDTAPHHAVDLTAQAMQWGMDG